jgi:dimethylargininase
MRFFVLTSTDEGGVMSKKALVRQPSPRLAEGLVTFLERGSVDVDLAVRQWKGYVDALGKAGWETIEVDPIESCPDGVFIEDTMVVFRNVAVIAHPGHPTRRAEVDAAEKAVAALGYSINHIREPGTLDGGDILKVGRRIYVGRGGRTNAEGVRQLRSFLEPLGARVTAVPLTKVLHLKSAVTALPDGTVIGYTPVVDDPSFFPHYIGMPEESGAHAVDLGAGRVLIAADCPKSAALIENLGYEVIAVDISEYQKLEGCVTCLSVRLRGLPS